jgi:uncharacterized protein (DUF58 family)
VDAELLKKVRTLHLKANHLVNSVVAGTYQAAFRGKGIEFQEVRPYQIGDDVRDIDWNVTARLAEPFVKLYHEERELTVMLLVDLSASQRFGSRHALKRQRAAEIAAVLACSAIKNNDKVGLFLFTDRVEKVVLPRKGRGHVWRVIREILDFRPRHRGTDLGAALSTLNRTLQRRAVVFLLSDFLNSIQPRSALQVAARRHDLIGLAIRDQAEWQLPDLGWLAVEHPETGDRGWIPTSGAAPRLRLAKAAETQARATRGVLAQARAALIELNCRDDYLPALVRFFHRRERGRR